MSTTQSRVESTRRSRKSLPIAALAFTLALGGGALLSPPSAADEPAEGTLVTAEMPAASAGIDVDYTAYLPAGYEGGSERFATIYLMHGRGDSMAAWPRVKSSLDQMIADGTIAPVVVIMPDAPWSDRGNYYVDSDFAGNGEIPAGAKVETAFTTDLVGHVDATYRTVPNRAARAVGGYSMGGYGALRYSLAHQDIFSAGLVLSPATYIPTPPDDSSAREFGAFGLGSDLFDEATYEAKNYPALLSALDASTPTHLFIAVGDDEWMNPDPDDADHDLDFEAARLYNTVRRSDAITTEFRVMNGGHDWDTWEPAFKEGIVDVMSRVRTSDPELIEGDLFGTAGDDRAGGLAITSGGGEVLAVNTAGDYGDLVSRGGMDGLVIARDGDGATRWITEIATSRNDRIYGIEPGPDGALSAAGYTRGNLDGDHPSEASDDAFAARMTADGDVSWITQFGDPSSADRIYASAPAIDGGVLVAGYTTGVIAGDVNAGDKDAFLARINPDGTTAWVDQLGGSGEDKGQGIAQAPDGSIYVGGLASAEMPDSPSLGNMDGWVAKYTADGEREWVRQVGTAEGDQVLALAISPDGTVLAGGHTAGVMGEASAGANDAFVRKLGVDGSTLWTTQVGSLGDDRTADLAVDADGSIILAGHTDGRIVLSAGGTDVFTAKLDADGSLNGVRQFGSSDRDGADFYDEGNLYVALDADGSSVLSGLTYGSTTTDSNSGEADVFLTALTQDDGPAPSPSPTPSPSASATASPSPSPSGSASASPTASPVSSSPTPPPNPSPSPSPTSSAGPVDVYSTPGFHLVNGRNWFTTCEPYSQTIRCRTDIWATQVRLEGGQFVNRPGWYFNNLTYLPAMKRAQWSSNPLGYTGSWTSTEGRKWQTECDTARSGGNGCRSSVWTKVDKAVAKPGGGYTFTSEWAWVFNNIVRFS
ncbi:MAG: alpha/beta hydrolase-fold protein [Arachnia sp.]